jgi:hypothetical protein
MIDAYLDESGIHDGAAVCVIAGFFGGRGQWRKFEALWRKTLSEFGVPLKEFHAKDVIKRRGHFDGWPDDRHSFFMRKLSMAITTFKIHPVSVGVVVADFQACSHPQRRFLTGARLDKGKLVMSGAPNKPYFCPFQECIIKVLDYTPVGGKAHFFFGLDRTFYEYATVFMKGLQDDGYTEQHQRIGTSAYPLAKETPELQAADFFAYLTYLDMLDRLKNDAWQQRPPDLLGSLLIRARSHDDFQYYEKSAIAEIFKRTYPIAGNWDGHPEVPINPERDNPL